jgi:hypothetical protein
MTACQGSPSVSRRPGGCTRARATRSPGISQYDRAGRLSRRRAPSGSHRCRMGDETAAK